MNLIQIILIIIGIFVWGAIFAMAHEQDIYNACVKYGETKQSMWTRNIKCEVKYD